MQKQKQQNISITVEVMGTQSVVSVNSYCIPFVMPPVLIKTTTVKLFDQIPSVKSSKGNTSMIDDTDVIRREIIKLNKHKDIP